MFRNSRCQSRYTVDGHLRLAQNVVSRNMVIMWIHLRRYGFARGYQGARATVLSKKITNLFRPSATPTRNTVAPTFFQSQWGFLGDNFVVSDSRGSPNTKRRRQAQRGRHKCRKPKLPCPSWPPDWDTVWRAFRFWHRRFGTWTPPAAGQRSSFWTWCSRPRGRAHAIDRVCYAVNGR